jgi:hypothetical protein
VGCVKNTYVMIRFNIYKKDGTFVDGYCENPFKAIAMIAKFKLQGYLVVLNENLEDLN